MDKFGRFTQVSTSERVQNAANMRAYVADVKQSLVEMNEKLTGFEESTQKQFHNYTESITKLTEDVRELREEIKKKATKKKTPS